MFVFPSIHLLCQLSLTPDSDWGGEGSLGCGIGYGYLHRLPAHKTTAQPQTDLEMGAPEKPSPIASSAPPAEGYSDVSAASGISA